MMSESDRFDVLCNSDFVDYAERTINIYNEKRLHKILKRFFCDDESCYEKKVGNFTADVLFGDRIFEIQTKNLRIMSKKLEYYLNETEYKVTLVYPIISEKKIVRIDRDSGEILRIRKSPKKIGYSDIMQELYHVSKFISHPRFDIKVLYIGADEHRYSDEAVRYRRSGKYDSEIIPRQLLRIEDYTNSDDFAFLLDGIEGKFSASNYKKLYGFSGRKLYSTLNLLCNVGLLERRQKTSRSYEYEIKQ